MITSLGLMSSVWAIPLVVGALWLDVPANGKPDSVPAGTWGGKGIGMEVTETGARLEYDCAHGTIGQPIRMDDEGRFEVKGTYVQERGGPAREGAEEHGRPVRYVGRVEETTMTLTVMPLDRDEAIGTYTLVHGKPPRVRKCL